MTRTDRSISSVGAPDWDLNKITIPQTGVPIEKDGVITFVTVVNSTYHIHVAINSKENFIQSFGHGTDAHGMRVSTIIRVSKGDILYVGYGDMDDPTWVADGSTNLDIKDGSNVTIASAWWSLYPCK